MSQTSTATKSAVGRVGLGFTIASVVVLAVVLVKILFAAIAGNVTLNSADDVTRLFTLGIILTGVAGVLGLVATIVHGMGLGKGFTTGKGVNTGISVVVLLASAALLFTTLLPRANAVQNLNNKVVPFGYSMRDNCQTPLDNSQNDIKQDKTDADNHATDDPGFAAAMGADITKIQADSSALNSALNKLNSTTAPDSKYQALLDGCVKDVKSEIALINDSSSIPFPAAVVAIVHIQSVSVKELLTDGAAVASGQITLTGVPAHSAQMLVSQVLAQVVSQNGDPQLTAEGNQLRDDINATLKNNLAPFKAGPSLQA
jgi:hypothetical protein